MINFEGLFLYHCLKSVKTKAIFKAENYKEKERKNIKLKVKLFRLWNSYVEKKLIWKMLLNMNKNHFSILSESGWIN